jgi:SAM-dependent methyltransferase
MTNPKCRSCGDLNLQTILDLGFSPPSNAMLNPEDLLQGETHYPLVLLFCDNCKLAQTRDFHKGNELFTPDYPYLSSTSASWVEHSKNLVQSLVTDFNLSSESLVAEIASNDGYLLQHLTNLKIPNYGIEPTGIAASISKKKGHTVYEMFLNIQNSHKIVKEQGTADIVIANNVFAHVPDLVEFTVAAKNLLKPLGTLIIEVQYFGGLFEQTLFDTIYHEHFSYFSVTSLSNLAIRNNLEIYRLDFIPTHGGSIRAYLRKARSNASGQYILEKHKNAESTLIDFTSLSTMQTKVEEKKMAILKFLIKAKEKKQSVVGYGAAAKGNTLLNYCGVSSDLLLFILDNASAKIGKLLPGSHIPVMHADKLTEINPDLIIIFAWNIAEEIQAEIRSKVGSKAKIFTLMPEIKEV